MTGATKKDMEYFYLSLTDTKVMNQLKAGDDCELVWAKIKIEGTKDLYIVSFYKPPDKDRPENDKPEYLDQLQKYIFKIPTQHGAHLWLRGDFNLADIDWPNECVVPYPSYGVQCQKLLTNAKDAFLSKMDNKDNRDQFKYSRSVHDKQ